MSITTIIIAITCIFSIIAFNKREIMYRYQFNAYAIKHNNQWFRFFTYAFLHADWTHLLFNMITLYSFGEYVEHVFKANFGEKAAIYYLLLYIGGIFFSTTYSFEKNKDNHTYNAIGASGAVSAVLFSSILFNPLGMLGIYFVIPIPAILFGVLYLLFSAYMAKKGGDNIGHDVHFWGAVFGFVLPILLKPAFFLEFISNLKELLP
jgi:membrane associated rhomboid family serine protease